MKKKALAILLPVAAGVALAGTGFGVWVFQTETKNTIQSGLEVTPAIEIDEDTFAANITVANNGGAYSTQNIVFDQGYTTWGVKIAFSVDFTYNAGGADTLTSYEFGNSATWNDGTSTGLTKLPEAFNAYKITCELGDLGDLGNYVEAASANVMEYTLDTLTLTAGATDGEYTLKGEFELTYNKKDAYSNITDMTAYETFLGVVKAATWEYTLQLVAA